MQQSQHPRSRARGLPAAALGAALALAACADQAPTSAGVEPVGRPGQVLAYTDPAIDRTDSYVISDVVTQSSTQIYADQPFPDPHTGALVTSTTVTPAAEDARVDAGYDVYGSTRTTTFFPGDPDPNASGTDRVARVVTVGDVVTTYDASGNVIPSDGTAHEVNHVGSLQNATIGDGIVRTGDPGGGGGPVLMTNLTGSGPTPVRPRVERLPGDRVRLSVDATPPAHVRAAAARFSASGQAAESRTKVTQTYRKQGEVWILEEVKAEQEVRGVGGGARHTQTIRYKNVRWHKNKAKDEARARRRAQLAAAAPATPRAYTGECEPVLMTNCLGGGGMEPIGGTTTPPPCSSIYTYSRNPGYATGTNIVVQHGFMDNACSYAPGARVGNALHNEFYTDRLSFTTTDWTARYDDQAGQLINTLGAAPAGGYVMVGYSNGGIISRRVGHYRPDLVRGVVAVSSPHRGLPVMRLARSTFRVLLDNTFVGLATSCAIKNHAGCQARGLLGTQLGKPSPFGVDELVPVSAQMVPGHSFQATLNSTYEGFRRIGIEQHAQQRWVWARVAADLNCAGPELDCGGRRMVRRVDSAYRGMLTGSILSGIVGIFWTPSLYVSAALLTGASVMNTVDFIYDRYTSPGDGSDGVVPNASQRYPNGEYHEVISNADSHDAAKKSDKAILRLKQVLYDRFSARTVSGRRP